MVIVHPLWGMNDQTSYIIKQLNMWGEINKFDNTEPINKLGGGSPTNEVWG